MKTRIALALLLAALCLARPALALQTESGPVDAHGQQLADPDGAADALADGQSHVKIGNVEISTDHTAQ